MAEFKRLEGWPRRYPWRAIARARWRELIEVDWVRYGAPIAAPVQRLGSFSTT